MKQSYEPSFGETLNDDERALFSRIHHLMCSVSFLFTLKPEMKAQALSEIGQILKKLLSPERFVGESKTGLMPEDIILELDEMANATGWHLKAIYQLALSAVAEILDEYRHLMGERPLHTDLNESEELKILSFLEEDIVGLEDDEEVKHEVLSQMISSGRLRPDPKFLDLVQIYCKNKAEPNSRVNSFPNALEKLFHAFHEAVLQAHYQVMNEENSLIDEDGEIKKKVIEALASAPSSQSPQKP